LERKSKKAKLELAVENTVSERNSGLSSNINVKTLKNRKSRSRLPVQCHRKKVENMNDLFRNNHVLQNDHSSNISQPTPRNNNEVIVIDDDEGLEETSIEHIGEEISGLLSGGESKISSEMECNESKEVLHDTITLDDTQDQSDILSDSIMILDEKQSEEPIQDIVSKYYTTDTSIEFISIHSKDTDDTSLLPGRSRRTHKKNPGIFGPNKAPNFNFDCDVAGRSRGSEGQVFHFTGRKETSASADPASTMYSQHEQVQTGLRPIVIDGSNIAFAHGRSQIFSVKGIEMVVQYFKNRGHGEVVAFLPQFRLNNPENRDALRKMEIDGTITFTPSRKVDGKHISSYDDRMILDYATEKGAIVISRDNYRDLYEENMHYRVTIEKRILMPSFVSDTVIFPQDPLGRNGPRLDEFLKF